MSATTWYGINKYDYRTEEVQIVRESEHYIWLAANKWRRERRMKKVSEWGHYYRTAKEALDQHRSRATQRLEAIEEEAKELRQLLADMSPTPTTADAQPPAPLPSPAAPASMRLGEES